jgi:exosortase family protein XrtF
MLKQPLFKFLLLFSISLGLFFIGYEFILKPSGTIDHYLTEVVTIGIIKLLHFTGYDASYTIGKQVGSTYLFISPQLIPVVKVGASCNGLELLVLFTLFIIAYPGKWKYKFPFILVGNIIIHTLNIFRNYVLTLLAYQKSAYYDFFHRYVFIFFIYGVVFLLWLYWTNKLSTKK